MYAPAKKKESERDRRLRQRDQAYAERKRRGGAEYDTTSIVAPSVRSQALPTASIGFRDSAAPNRGGLMSCSNCRELFEPTALERHASACAQQSRAPMGSKEVFLNGDKVGDREYPSFPREWQPPTHQLQIQQARRELAALDEAIEVRRSFDSDAYLYVPPDEMKTTTTRVAALGRSKVNPQQELSPARGAMSTAASKAEYAQDLDLQIRLRKEREAREREQELAKEQRAQRESESYYPWGQPGGGAPMRDQNGRIVTDLRELGQNLATFQSPLQQLRQPPSSSYAQSPPRQQPSHDPYSNPSPSRYQSQPVARGDMWEGASLASDLSTHRSFKIDNPNRLPAPVPSTPSVTSTNPSEYRLQLQEQIRETQERKERERAAAAAWDAKVEREAAVLSAATALGGQGGGGAPMRGPDGAVLTDLRKAFVPAFRAEQLATARQTRAGLYSPSRADGAVGGPPAAAAGAVLALREEDEWQEEDGVEEERSPVRALRYDGAAVYDQRERERGRAAGGGGRGGGRGRGGQARSGMQQQAVGPARGQSGGGAAGAADDRRFARGGGDGHSAPGGYREGGRAPDAGWLMDEHARLQEEVVGLRSQLASAQNLLSRYQRVYGEL